MSLLTLDIVPGRVLERAGDVLRVELPSAENARAAAGEVWVSADGASVCELGAPLNPTERRAVVRRGPAPRVGDVLSAGAPMRLPEPRRVRGGELLSPAGVGADDPRYGAGPTPAPLRSPEAQGSPGALVSTGCASLDVLAPLARGASLALTSDAMGALRGLARASILPALGASHDRVLWLAPGVCDAPAPGPSTVTLAPERDGDGELALMGRAAAALVRGWAQAGERVAVVWDDPCPFLGAWMRVDADARGTAAGAAAQAMYEELLRALTAPGPDADRAPSLLVLMPEWSVAPALPGLRPEELAGLHTSAAELSEAQTLIDATRSRLFDAPGATSAQHRAVAEATREVFASRDTLEDHAFIFGADELTDAQLELREVCDALARTLDASGAAPLELDALVRRCVLALTPSAV